MRAIKPYMGSALKKKHNPPGQRPKYNGTSCCQRPWWLQSMSDLQKIHYREIHQHQEARNKELIITSKYWATLDVKISKKLCLSSTSFHFFFLQKHLIYTQSWCVPRVQDKQKNTPVLEFCAQMVLMYMQRAFQMSRLQKFHAISFLSDVLN